MALLLNLIASIVLTCKLLWIKTFDKWLNVSLCDMNGINQTEEWTRHEILHCNWEMLSNLEKSN